MKISIKIQPSRIFLITILIISWIIPIFVFSHSGNTDVYSCHTCYTNCSSYGLYYGQYHCHPYKFYPECEKIWDELASMPTLEGRYQQCVRDHYKKDQLNQLQQEQQQYNQYLESLQQQQQYYNQYLESIQKQEELLNELQRLYSEQNLANLCPQNSQYSNGKCICNSGYLFLNNSCLPSEIVCISKFGQAMYNSSSNNCQCKEGYVLNDNQTQCILGDDFCSIKYGNNIKFNSEKLTCECIDGYTFNGIICVSITSENKIEVQQIKNDIKPTPAQTLINKKSSSTTTENINIDKEKQINISDYKDEVRDEIKLNKEQAQNKEEKNILKQTINWFKKIFKFLKRSK